MVNQIMTQGRALSEYRRINSFTDLGKMSVGERLVNKKAKIKSPII
jgi:hypothetical protein